MQSSESEHISRRKESELSGSVTYGTLQDRQSISGGIDTKVCANKVLISSGKIVTPVSITIP